jgi:hypothetical protein
MRQDAHGGSRPFSSGQERIADLALLDYSGSPRLLVEIKDADEGKKENAANARKGPNNE